MRWLRCALVVVGLVALGACHVDRPSQQDLSPGVDPAGTVSPTLPDGWRWESYRNIEVGVPGDWGWGNGAQRLDQWCTNPKHPKPIVGRLGPTTLVGCPTAAPGAPDPQTLIKHTGQIVTFRDVSSTNPIPRGGDRQVVTYGRVAVVVQVPATLRSQIVATIHLVKVDHHGCPATDSVSRHPGQRPRSPRDLATLRGVTSVSVCRYALGPEGGLESSSRLDGGPAARIVRQIAAAPNGGGPNSPQTCRPGFGDQIIVLRVASSAGSSEVYVRYSTCDHNGFDDGTTVRTLTRAPVQALIAGPNALWSWDEVLDPILGKG